MPFVSRTPHQEPGTSRDGGRPSGGVPPTGHRGTGQACAADTQRHRHRRRVSAVVDQ